jgi:hypothetical protein
VQGKLWSLCLYYVFVLVLVVVCFDFGFKLFGEWFVV